MAKTIPQIYYWKEIRITSSYSECRVFPTYEISGNPDLSNLIFLRAKQAKLWTTIFADLLIYSKVTHRLWQSVKISLKFIPMLLRGLSWDCKEMTTDRASLSTNTGWKQIYLAFSGYGAQLIHQNIISTLVERDIWLLWISN